MNRKILVTLLLLLFAICFTKALAQEPPIPPRPSRPSREPREPRQPLPATAPQTATTDQSVEERKLEPGRKVVVRNQYGQITIIGWDRDTVQVKATSEGRGEAAQVKIIEDPASGGKLIIAPAIEGRRGGNIRLDLKLPHYAEIESVSTGYGDVEVTGIDGSVTVSTGNGNLKISRVGSLNATTGAGDVTVDTVNGRANIATNSGSISVNRVSSLEAGTRNGDLAVTSVSGSVTVRSSSGSISARDIKGDFIAKVMNGDVNVESVIGLVNVTVTSGDLAVQSAGGDVRAVAISGDTKIQCAKGRAEVSCASGSITLSGIGGDVDAVTVSGDVNFVGAMRVGGRYRLKSTSGDVHMAVQADAPGFAATLSSYNGDIETDFPIKVEGGPLKGRIIGRYGDGQACVTLDSFSGTVNLKKVAPGKSKDCK